MTTQITCHGSYYTCTFILSSITNNRNALWPCSKRDLLSMAQLLNFFFVASYHTVLQTLALMTLRNVLNWHSKCSIVKHYFYIAEFFTQCVSSKATNAQNSFRFWCTKAMSCSTSATYPRGAISCALIHSYTDANAYLHVYIHVHVQHGTCIEGS